MTDREFENKLKLAYKMVDNLSKNELYEDVKQEIAISLWLNPNESLENIVVLARKKVLGDEAKHTRKRAPSLYNEDGDCLDDDLYFVDPNTVEQFGERKGISDDLREKGLKVAHTMNLLNQLTNRLMKNKKADSAYKCYQRYSWRGFAQYNNYHINYDKNCKSNIGFVKGGTIWIR